MLVLKVTTRGVCVGRQIRHNIYSVGAIDWDRKLFDEIVRLPGGTSYNSYLLIGSEKTALIDTVDPSKAEELLNNLALHIPSKTQKIDYIISNHAEQDHSGSIPLMLEKYPDAKVICNQMCKNLLIDEHAIAEERFEVIKEHDTLSLGKDHGVSVTNHILLTYH